MGTLENYSRSYFSKSMGKMMVAWTWKLIWRGIGGSELYFGRGELPRLAYGLDA